MMFGPDIGHFRRLPTKLMELIFLKVMGSGHYSDVKFLCRCFLVSKYFYKAIRYMSNISINHYCLEELHDFMPKVLKTFKFVRYLYVHHGSPPSLNKFNWKVTLQPVGINFLYGMTALSYNYIQKRSRDDEEAPLPVTGIYSKGSLTFGIGLNNYPSPYFAQLLPKPNKRKQIWRNDCIKEMYSEDSNVQLRGTRRLAELLEADRRLGDLRSEDVRLLIGLLGHGEKPELQFYGALALTYVDSDGAEIIREEAIPSLVGLMISKHARTQMRGMFILMRIAYDFPKSVRDLHKFGVLELLKDMVYSHRRNYYELLNCATFLAIVCRAKSILQACEIRVACHTAKLILQYGDDEVKPQTLLALSYLSNGSCIPLKQFPRRYVLKLIKRHVDPSIVILTLQVVGNIMAWGGYDQKKFMLTKGLLKRLHRLKLPQYKILRYEACRIIQIIEKERQIINLPLGTFKIHKLEGTDICSIIENEKGEKINFAEHDDDFLKSLPIKVQSNSLDMSSFMPLLPEEEVTTKFLELKWMAEYYTPNEFPSYLATREWT